MHFPPRNESSLPLNERPQRKIRFLIPVLVLSAFLIGYGVRSFVYLVNPPDRRNWSHGNTEETRITSPNASLDAVISCRCDTPAMVSPFFYLHIVPKGRKLGEYSSPAVLESRENLKLEWIDNAHLRVDPAQGTIEYFTNLWAPNDDKLSIVEIILAQDPAHGLLTPQGHFEGTE